MAEGRGTAGAALCAVFSVCRAAAFWKRRSQRSCCWECCLLSFFYFKDALANRRDVDYFPTLLCDSWCLFCFIPQLPYSSFLKSRTEPTTACSKRWVPLLPWLTVSLLLICWISVLNSEASSRVRLQALHRTGLQDPRYGVGLCLL